MKTVQRKKGPPPNVSLETCTVCVPPHTVCGKPKCLCAMDCPTAMRRKR